MWSPVAKTMCQWVPAGGWPPIFNARDRIACATYYEYFVRAKAKNPVAEALMRVYASKYKHLSYKA
jgi:hypothetical protein